MIIDHLTALTNHVLQRDTATILPTTERNFREFSRLSAGQHALDIEKTPFTCRITLAKEGALFDLYLQDTDNLLFTNVCCFVNVESETMLNHVSQLVQTLPMLQYWQVKKPVTPAWLYSIPINPFVATPEQLQMAGEIEFYIWNALLRAVTKIRIL